MEEKKIKQAFILGAGLGSRMRPLTDTMPKPMIPLGGKPLIDHVIARLQKAGVEKFVVNVHYLAEKLEAHLKNKTNIEIIISNERDELLDTGGGLMKAKTHLDDEPFFIHNSDSVWIEENKEGCSNLSRMVKAFDANKMQSLMLLADRQTALGYDGKGDFVFNEDQTLTRRTGDEATDYVFAGVSVAHPSLLLGAQVGAFSLNKLWDAALSNHTVYGLKHQGLWMHVGTPDSLKQAEVRLKKSQNYSDEKAQS